MFRHPSWRLRKFSGGLLGFSSELAKGVMVWERAVKDRFVILLIITFVGTWLPQNEGAI